MKISRNWLQKYVSKEIPKGEDFVNLLSMNIFEVEGFEKLKNGDEVFDVKVLADRNAYCLSHRGIARELAVLLDAEFKIPENKKNVVESLPNYEAKIETSGICRKCLLRKVTDINILESPEWLKTALESVGQRSISPIVDATNYVMLDTGQPLHAFDADLVDGDIEIRLAKKGEKITTLDKRDVVLNETILINVDDKDILDIAGVKGGQKSAVTASTKNIILEAANFNPSFIRKASSTVNIRNDASKRFENNLPLEFADTGMDQVSEILAEMSPQSKFSPIFYFGDKKDKKVVVETTMDFIRECVGIEIPDDEIISILKKCDMQVEGNLKVTAPSYRRDINIPQDLAEEVGRIYGYEKITNAMPVRVESGLKNDKEFTIAEYIRDQLVSIGFNEIIGYALREDGDFILEMPLSKDKNTLRKTLVDSTREYIESNSRYLDLMGINQAKIFEISRIFPKSGEKTVLSLGVINQKGAKVEKAHIVLQRAFKHLLDNGVIIDGTVAKSIEDSDKKGTESKMVYDRKMELAVSPDVNLNEISIDEDRAIYHKKDQKYSVEKHLVKFTKISQYPFATRDIAVLVPGPSGNEMQVYDLLVKEAMTAMGNENFVRATLFDVFTKEFDGVEKTSYAFRLVFQSHTETLKDEAIDNVMKKTAEVVAGMGWVVR